MLVTTRDPQRALGDDAARVGLDMLERDDALALADKITDGCAEEDLAARDRVVLKELGALAVAVEMAARAVRKWTKTWTRYETELKTHDAALLEDPKLYGEAYDRGAFGAIDLSLERCTDPAARALLNSLATMAPESAPMDWAEAGAGLTTGTLEADRAWEAIADGGFVRLTVTERAERQVSLHRLVHRRLAATMPARDRAGCAARMAPTVETWLDETVDASRLQVVELRVPHGIAILDALAVDEKGLLWIRIADHLAHHFWHQGSYETARRWLERALEAAERLSAPEELRVAPQLSNLALVLKDLGDANGARPLLERAVAMAEKRLGPAHPNTRLFRKNLASLEPPKTER
ncbi:MAG: tetratricopeptide repeat protein [Polyangiaceae bacterium]